MYFAQPPDPVIVHAASHRSTTLSFALYATGFVLQVLGGMIVLMEIRGDLRVADRIPDHLTLETLNAFPRYVKQRLAGHMGRRIVGVALIFIGAAVGLAANLVALSS
jgi:hypothetical protein